jgi:hypothetical protein
MTKTSNQRRTSEHSLADFLDNIFPIMFPDEDHPPTSSSHATHSAQTMDEVDTGMRDII